jgi:hypothetical protein
MRKVIAMAVVGVLGVVGLAACGGDDDGSVSVERDGTSVDVKKDGGKVTVKSKDGDGSVSVGDDAEVPDNFPDDVPLPEGGKVGLAAEGERDGKQYFSITYVVSEDDVDDAFSSYADALEDAGFDLGDRSSYSGGGGEFSSIQATSDDWEVVAVKVAGGNDDGGISIQVTQV